MSLNITDWNETLGEIVQIVFVICLIVLMITGTIWCVHYIFTHC